MALKKQIQTPQGVFAEYWRIVEFSTDFAGKHTDVVIAVYLDEAARSSDKVPLSRRSYYFEDFSAESRSELYVRLKQEDYFSDAEDA